MKNKIQFVITFVLSLAIIVAIIPSSVFASIYKSGINLFTDNSELTEDEIYESVKNESSSQLISEIKEMESSLKSDTDKQVFLPYLLALIDKSNEFSTDQLLELLYDDKTDVCLDCAFIRMLFNKSLDNSTFLNLLKNDSIQSKIKEYIVILSDFSVSEYMDLFNYFSDSTAIIIMKKITSLDDNIAYELSSQILFDTENKYSDDKIIAAFLGTANFYEKRKVESDESNSKYLSDKESVISKIKDIYNSSNNDLVKDQAIYALSRMNDFNVFKYIIQSNVIDFDLKVSTVERNIPLISDVINNSASMDDIDTIITAMYLHPIIDIANALESAIYNKQLTNDTKIQLVIKYIYANGIKGVNKYE